MHFIDGLGIHHQVVSEVRVSSLSKALFNGVIIIGEILGGKVISRGNAPPCPRCYGPGNISLIDIGWGMNADASGVRAGNKRRLSVILWRPF